MSIVLKVRRLRRVEASKYLMREYGISLGPKTLAKLAVIGGGPAYQKDGRFPLYSEASLDAYAEARLSPEVTSTTELAALKSRGSA